MPIFKTDTYEVEIERMALGRSTQGYFLTFLVGNGKEFTDQQLINLCDNSSGCKKPFDEIDIKRNFGGRVSYDTRLDEPTNYTVHVHID